MQIVRTRIGPIATPDVIEWTPNLPKNRSGKILRRVLTKIAAGDFDHLGDVSTVADPALVGELVACAKAMRDSCNKANLQLASSSIRHIRVNLVNSVLPSLQPCRLFHIFRSIADIGRLHA